MNEPTAHELRVEHMIGEEYQPPGDRPEFHMPLRLADFECEHGRLPHDGTPPCGCWSVEMPEPTFETALDKLAAIRRQAIERGDLEEEAA